MAFSFGFFNSKNLDRTYTAENFNDYLGSIICDGIQDNFGQCFKLSANKLKLTIGSGKAWIQGHYFISDTAYTYDLSRYVDESLPRYMTIGICCNTSENVRNVSFEILAGTPATNPAIPRFQNTDYKKYLTLCIVRLDAGTSELSITDYRENNNFCGYVRCILGKCKVTDMLSQLSEIQTQIKDYNITVSQLTTKINELTLKIDEMTGDVVSIGKCGQNVNFVLYSDGRLLLKGTGATFDYSTDSNPSPLQNNANIKSVIVSEGVTGIGERLFQYCDNLELVFTRKIWYNRRAMRYTSDMTDSQWEIIKPILQEAKYRSLEEKREQINAVFYLVKTGCQWRNLPKDFPKWKTVYSFYRRACLNGIWDKIQKALVKKVRLAKGKKEIPSYALIDSQSAKTVSSNEKRGYDGGKKRKEEKDT